MALGAVIAFFWKGSEIVATVAELFWRPHSDLLRKSITVLKLTQRTWAEEISRYQHPGREGRAPK